MESLAGSFTAIPSLLPATVALSCGGSSSVCSVLHLRHVDGAHVVWVLLCLSVLVIGAIVRRLLHGHRRCQQRVPLAVLVGAFATPPLLRFLVPAGGKHATVRRGPCDGLSYAGTEATQALPTWGIVAPFQNEALGIVEWLDSHALEGASEFVLIEDASTDNSPRKARWWAAKHPGTRLVIVKRGARRTQKQAVNDGVRHATSDWLAIIDLDEFLFSRLAFAPSVSHYLGRVPREVRGCVHSAHTHPGRAVFDRLHTLRSPAPHATFG